jgi:hypothetical protein
MDILETIVGAQNGAAVDQLAAQFGLRPEQASAAMSALMPALAAGFQKNMATEGGLASLVTALSSGKHQAYLDNPTTVTQPTTAADGNAILGHLFGSKEVSRQVAANAAQRTGVDASVLKKMLPILAALAMGAMARQTRTATPAGRPDPNAARGGLMSMLEPLLDRNRDGSMIDDVAGIVGGFLGGRGRG